MPATPDPDLAQRLARAVADVYGQGATDLLDVVARRVARGIDSPGWAERKLVELAGLRSDADAILARLARDGGPAIAQAIREAASAGAGDAEADGVTVRGQLGAATHTRAVDQIVTETVTALRSTHTQILRSTEDAYRSIVAEASAQAVAGTTTRRAAAQHALDRLTNAGIRGFVDRAGRNWEIESYAEMATRTAVGRAQVAGTLDRFVAAGRDLVIVSDHAQECEVCRPWESKVLSITGATPRGERLVDGTEVAGTVAQAQADGLLHANCRHALTAYIPGLTRPRKGQPDPAGDAARQEQRRLERGLRMWKRRAAVAMDPQARRRADAKAREWRQALEQHVARHDLKRQRHREVARPPKGSAPPRPVAPPKPVPPPEPDVPEHLRRITAARDRFDDMPRPTQEFGRPGREVQEREAARHKVGEEVDRVVTDRIRAAGIPDPADADRAHRAAQKAYDKARAAQIREVNKRNPDPAALDRVNAEFNRANRELIRARGDAGAAHRAWDERHRTETLAVLDDLGITRGGVPHGDLVRNLDAIEPALRGSVAKALDLFPTSWLLKAAHESPFDVVHENPRAFMQRAYAFASAKMNLAPHESVSVIAHEFGHHVENTNPEVKLAEWAFYWRRVGDERTRKLSEIVGHDGYSDREIAREDKFANPYMGKDYGGRLDSSYELMSMAAEAYLSPRDDWGSTGFWGNKAWADADMRRWFLGVLVTA